jgi:hypothetical protein
MAVETDDSRAILDEMRAELAACRSRIEELERGRHETQRSRRKVEAKSTDEGVGLERHTDRRNFFKVAGAAAAGAAAASVLGSADPAAAATGGAMIIGGSNIPTAIADTTVLFSPSSTDLMHETMRIRNFSSGSYDPPTTEAIALFTSTSGADAAGNKYKIGTLGNVDPGTSGSNSGSGVVGTSLGADPTHYPFAIGVQGKSTGTGDGVYGECSGSTVSYAIEAVTTQGYGVFSTSNTGISLWADGGGRIGQNPRGTVGAPASGSFDKGEQIRDANGDLFICTASGSPGTWRKVAAQHPSFNNAGGSINLLSSPIRIMDTRPGSGAPITNGSARLQPGVNTPIQVTGTAVNGIVVPAGAKGAIGNVTVVDNLGQGYLTLWPNGQPVPLASSINYLPGDIVANFFTVGLDGTGKLAIRVDQHATHAILDITGFIF